MKAGLVDVLCIHIPVCQGRSVEVRVDVVESQSFSVAHDLLLSAYQGRRDLVLTCGSVYNLQVDATAVAPVYWHSIWLYILLNVSGDHNADNFMMAFPLLTLVFAQKCGEQSGFGLARSEYAF